MDKVFLIIIFCVAVSVEESPQVVFSIPRELIDYDYIEENDSSTTIASTSIASPAISTTTQTTSSLESSTSQTDNSKIAWKSQWGTLEITGLAAIVVIICIAIVAVITWNVKYLEQACLTRCACCVCQKKSSSFIPHEQHEQQGEKMQVLRKKNQKSIELSQRSSNQESSVNTVNETNYIIDFSDSDINSHPTTSNASIAAFYTLQLER
jgi:hypothetical protein